MTAKRGRRAQPVPGGGVRHRLRAAAQSAGPDSDGQRPTGRSVINLAATIPSSRLSPQTVCNTAIRRV